MSEVSRCGYIALLGRPNVGKSTLLNHILGQIIAITSRKPQTTRHRLLGIKTHENVQAVFVDTPGLHQEYGKKALNRFMNRSALHAMYDVDVIVFMIDGLNWQEDDEWILQKLKEIKSPVVLVVNKVDQLKDKKALLPWLNALQDKMDFAAILPLSAIKPTQVVALEQEIFPMLPEGEHLFADDQITDKSERFLCAEIVREKLTRQLGQELPYAITVEIEKFKLEKEIYHVSALILVERDSQKGIVVGKKGEQLKKTGEKARKDMERLLDNKVFLKLWVKVKSKWSEDEKGLRDLGYEE